MYKHLCVECLQKNFLKCKWNISFIDRLLGNDKVKYCPEYMELIKKGNKK